MGIDNEQVGFLAQIYYDIEETNFSKRNVARKLNKKDKNFCSTGEKSGERNKMNNLKIKLLFSFYLLILSLNSFSSPNLENLVVDERFGEIVQQVEAITNPSWQDSFYAGYAHLN